MANLQSVGKSAGSPFLCKAVDYINPLLDHVSDVVLVRTDPGKNWISGLTHSAFIAFYMMMNFAKDIKVNVLFWAVFM